MDLSKDADLLYIAEEGLKAPVPEPWKAYSNEADQIYYKNSTTNEVIYDHPLDEKYKRKFKEAKFEKKKKEQEFDEARKNDSAVYNSMDISSEYPGHLLSGEDVSKKSRNEKIETCYQEQLFMPAVRPLEPRTFEAL